RGRGDEREPHRRSRAATARGRRDRAAAAGRGRGRRGRAPGRGVDRDRLHRRRPEGAPGGGRACGRGDWSARESACLTDPDPPGGGVRLPSWAFGFAAAWSSAGDAVAVVPKPDQTTERLYLVGSATLRLRGQISLEGHDVCALAWPARRTILALAGENGCYNGQRRLLALRIDPFVKRIVSRTAVPVDWSVDAVAAVPGGVAAVVRD